MSKCFDVSGVSHEDMQFTRADIFDWLALTEAISYEDFNFVAIANDLISVTDVEAAPSPCEQVFSLPYTDKRLLVVSSLFSSKSSSAQVGDITCIRTVCHEGKCLCQSEIEHIVGSLSNANFGNVCLSWHCCSRKISDIIRQYHALQHIEWVWCGEQTDDAVYAGLILSPCWRSGTSEHVAKIMANYNATLPPGPRGEARLAFSYQ